MHSIAVCCNQAKCKMQAGVVLLAQTLRDNTRCGSPSSFNGLLFSASSSSAGALASQLQTINDVCPIPELITCSSYAKSLSTLEQDKFIVYEGQSLEWRELNLQSLKLLQQKQISEELALVNEQAQSLITNIDEALAEATELKAARDERLNQSFSPQNTGVSSQLFTSSSAESLARQVEQQGDDSEFWALCLFVGEIDELNKIKEVL
ncbi:hypothetical protein L1077_23305 [Pseudoalteromonas luteoviolacea]|uniref:hypothetical protein n=1 Tax=Pseudoalteromonas luteoviolacea TaxID=43657 RepID=UPI001F16E232|nr:hypothetical protein [Pseudoalteromonas luteoviolacea]MCF6442359.1 hypothetical protein [Pseudoalteromonas luteoviolacea]